MQSVETRTEWDTSSEGVGKKRRGIGMRGLSEKEGDEQDEDVEGVWIRRWEEKKKEEREQDLGAQK